jgi:hypothetical protein
MQEETFTIKQMTDFGYYIKSKARFMSVINCENFMGINDVLIYSRISQVSHADFENWKESIKKQ